MSDDELESAVKSVEAYLALYDKGVADQRRTDRRALYLAVAALVLGSVGFVLALVAAAGGFG